MTYTPDKRERDARLAVAMGWRNVEVPVSQGVTEEWMGIPPDDFIVYGVPNSVHINCGMGEYRKVPRFHASHDAKHALLVWLAADEKRWILFVNRLFHPEIEFQRIYSIMREAMLASPEAVAIAADEALRQAGYYSEPTHAI